MNDEDRTEHRLERKDTIYVEVMSSPRPDEESEVVICKTVDISANGIQITLDRELPIGCILQLCVQFQDNNERLFVVGEVMWVRNTVGEDFLVGFHLFEDDDSDILEWKQAIANRLSD